MPCFHSLFVDVLHRKLPTIAIEKLIVVVKSDSACFLVEDSIKDRDFNLNFRSWLVFQSRFTWDIRTEKNAF